MQNHYMIIADLHLHSRYSGGTSRSITLENLEKYARIKGIDLLGTGDFTHPKWREELKKLEERDGILYTERGFPFVWQTEISLIYSQDGKGRRIHHIILSPNREIVSQIVEFLGKRGRLDYDGRPIFGFSSIELVENLMEISKDIEIIPAHIWTPWYSLFGSNSGFDSIKDCFGDKLKYIHALETGMSSDPQMNWRLSQLDDFNLVSFSDSHSFWPWRLGREATIFRIDKESLTYNNLIESIRKGRIEMTVETDPNYGKYHYDGHRNCNLRLSPQETKKFNGLCPVCGKPITKGVLYRVEQLADRPENYIKKDAPEFVRLVPLTELIAFSYNISQLNSKKNWEIYNKLMEKYGNEYNVLLKAPYEELREIANEKLAKIIILARENKLKILPGYDGVYGKIILEDEDNEVREEIITPDKLNSVKQKTLDMFK